MEPKSSVVIERGLVVSCQAEDSMALLGGEMMARMAMAAEQGGAKGFRADGIVDIQAIRMRSRLPIIGIIKREYAGYGPFITASMKEVDELMQIGPDIVAIDATLRARPEFADPTSYIRAIKARYERAVIMADVSNYEEGIYAWKAGADFIATTLSSYTPYTLNRPRPDIELIRRLAGVVDVPVIAEGNVATPDQAEACLEAGAYAVVVGGAITRPDLITKRFVEAMGRSIQATPQRSAGFELD